MSVKLTPRQEAVVRFMQTSGCHYIEYYPGDWGTDGRGAGYFFRSTAENKPPLHAATVDSLIKRGMMEWKDGGVVLSLQGQLWLPPAPSPMEGP